ncbi:MAG: NUDIX hydrolase [Parcubacteria group bacterium GW2011_GWC2_42_12]|nr:MAG: NUDIX hydrolase [Parcubacteria group bacterium GW2011_GWC2_42_12]HCC49382.1 hypothetical protein [Candidatus Jacksonbacteria bacterium]HCR14713.1 hypothetical protein [Candidatus Jacksonbacteria bacterium]
MIKNIIFDWSGVISDNLVTVYQTAMVMFEKFGAPKVSLEEFRKEWEQPYMIFYNKYLPKLSKAEEDETYKSIYPLMAEKYQPRSFSGICEILKRFNIAGIKMAVISSDPAETLSAEIKTYGLDGIFLEINSEVHDKTEVLGECVKRNQFNLPETIFIGDTTHEVEAGKIVGVKTGAVTWGFQNLDKLKFSAPDFILNDLNELSPLLHHG